MNITYTNELSIQKCRANPEHIHVFGDNLAGYGTAGQAAIRNEPNAFGIPTKRYPSMEAGSFFTDRDCEREHVLKALRELYSLAKRRTIVFPSNGIGTGMAKMREMSPKLFAEMNDILLKHFGVRNGR
ncbi:hypothetical protein D3C75_742900 [compost metagenome]